MKNTSLWRTTRRTLGIASLASSGVSSLWLALSAPALSGGLVLQTVAMLNAGLDIKLVRPALDHLVAGAQVQAMPGWLVMTLCGYGVVALYLSAYLAANREPGALRRLFSRRYWTQFAMGPGELRRREARRARRAAELAKEKARKVRA